jgi:hypothetical protein
MGSHLVFQNFSFYSNLFDGKNKTPLSSEIRGLSFHGMPLWGLGGWVNPMPLVVPAVEESLTK